MNAAYWYATGRDMPSMSEIDELGKPFQVCNPPFNGKGFCLGIFVPAYRR